MKTKRKRQARKRSERLRTLGKEKSTTLTLASHQLSDIKYRLGIVKQKRNIDTDAKILANERCLRKKERCTTENSKPREQIEIIGITAKPSKVE